MLLLFYEFARLTRSSFSLTPRHQGRIAYVFALIFPNRLSIPSLLSFLVEDEVLFEDCRPEDFPIPCVLWCKLVNPPIS